MNSRFPLEDRLAAAGAGSTWAVTRSVVIACSDIDLRGRLARTLTAMRWRVIEVGGAAEAIFRLDSAKPEALLVDSWLPDLQIQDFCDLVERDYPTIDVLRLDGVAMTCEIRSPRRHELLLALRDLPPREESRGPHHRSPGPATYSAARTPAEPPEESQTQPSAALPDMIGESKSMLELGSMIRLVAPTKATVLIEGETGTGKELVANAVHHLSQRRERPFAVLNCAAIPEALLEAELFGHVRGAFTGAVQSRTGRIVAADGGTLFLDEIGEMPLALQAKMLRFLECGEVQRVGDNEMMRVDVRVVAATHRPLEQHADDGLFRLDLYHRLAVFPVEVPPLRDRMDDLLRIAEHLLERRAESGPRKRLTPAAIAELMTHSWPGNVRELIHVLERGAILSALRSEIDLPEIRIRRRPR